MLGHGGSPAVRLCGGGALNGQRERTERERGGEREPKEREIEGNGSRAKSRPPLFRIFFLLSENHFLISALNLKSNG